MFLWELFYFDVDIKSRNGSGPSWSGTSNYRNPHQIFWNSFQMERYNTVLVFYTNFVTCMCTIGTIYHKRTGSIKINMAEIKGCNSCIYQSTKNRAEKYRWFACCFHFYWCLFITRCHDMHITQVECLVDA